MVSTLQVPRRCQQVVKEGGQLHPIFGVLWTRQVPRRYSWWVQAVKLRLDRVVMALLASNGKGMETRVLASKIDWVVASLQVRSSYQTKTMLACEGSLGLDVRKVASRYRKRGSA